MKDKLVSLETDQDKETYNLEPEKVKAKDDYLEMLIDFRPDLVNLLIQCFMTFFLFYLERTGGNKELPEFVNWKWQIFSAPIMSSCRASGSDVVRSLLDGSNGVLINWFRETYQEEPPDELPDHMLSYQRQCSIDPLGYPIYEKSCVTVSMRPDILPPQSDEMKSSEVAKASLRRKIYLA